MKLSQGHYTGRSADLVW